jgi:hypothetical protein
MQVDISNLIDESADAKNEDLDGKLSLEHIKFI